MSSTPTTAALSASPSPSPSPAPGQRRTPNGAQEFWRWWGDELRAMVPPAVAGWFVGDVATTDVIADAAGIAVVRSEGGALVPMPPNSQPVAADAVSTSPVLRELIAQGHDSVRLVLRADQVLVKSLVLPAAIEENLTEAIGFELDRYTPFKRAQVYFDCKIVKRDSARETIDVLLAVAARASVDPLLALLKRGGLSVASIGLDPAIARGQALEMLPESDKPPRKWGHLLRVNLALLAAALLLGLIALVLPIWQKRDKVVELIPLVSKTNAEFEASKRVHDEYSRLANEYNAISTRKHSVQPVLVVLEELTRISPDTTYSQTLDLKSSGKIRELTIIGEAQSASKVIEALEQSGLFQNAAQRSQTTRGSQANTERYHISTEIKPKPLPAAAVIEPAAPAAADAAPGAASATNATTAAKSAAPDAAANAAGNAAPVIVPPPASTPAAPAAAAVVVPAPAADAAKAAPTPAAPPKKTP